MKLFRHVFLLLACVLGVTGLATVQSTTYRAGPYTCTALPIVLSVQFPFNSASELRVINLGQNGTSIDPGTVLTLNSDYTVSGGGYNSSTAMQSGNVTVVSTGAHSVAVNDVIVILRNVPVNQPTAFVSGPLTAAVVEKAFDRASTVSQEISETLSRSLRFEEGETLDGTLNRTARSGKLLGFDANGNIEFSTGGSGGGGTTYTAGAGLQLNANEFSVLPDQSFNSLTVTDSINADLAGNADTATALETARLINGISFDGTANITVPAAAGALTGTSLASNVVASSLQTYADGPFGTMAAQNASGVSITGGTINGATVTGLADGMNPSDAVNLSQLQGVSSGIVLRTGVVAATTANITLSAPQTIDGQAVIAGNRVLVKNQAAPEENGIYDVAAGAWARSSDSNTAAELLVGYTYFVSGGSLNGASTWSINVAPTVLGADPVGFVQFSASQSYSAGTGLSLAGNQFSINSTVATLAGTQTLTNKTLTAPTVFGGTINATTIGATTRTTGEFTALGSTIGDNAYGLRVSGATNRLRFAGFNSTASYIDAVNLAESALTPLIIQGSTVSINPGGVSGGLFSSGGLAVTGALTATSNLTVHGNSYLSNLVSKSNQLNETATNGLASLLLNYDGYAGGTTQFRNTAIYDGKNALVATFTGSAKSLEVAGGIKGSTLQANGWINVKSPPYNAAGDGATNDTAAIAAAVAALASTNATLYFPPGTYITDTITITGKTGLSVLGDGNGVTTLKGRTGNRVLVISSTTGCVVRGIGFDGNCSSRTAGQQAVVIDASNLLFTQNSIINSGEFAIMVGDNAAVTNVRVIGNYIGSNFADGINIRAVSDFVVGDNIVDGSDDDCIAIGYSGSGAASHGVVSGNSVRARTDLGTTWGRGIWVGACSDILVIGNNVDTIKQTGIYVNDDGTGTRATRITIRGNKVRNAAINSGHGMAITKTAYVVVDSNTVEDQANGSSIEIADWQHLTITNNSLTQTVNVFARGIHADEGTGWTSPWDCLSVANNTIRMLGSSTNSCIYLVPNSAYTMSTGSINGNTGLQVAVGDYITVAGTNSGAWKLVNNLSQSGNSVGTSGAATFTVQNNW